MKKIVILILSLIVVLMSYSSAFANTTYELDPFSGEIINTISGDQIISNEARVSSDCVFNKQTSLFVYYLTSSAENTLSSSVCDGESVTGSVYIKTEAISTVSIYKDGEKITLKDTAVTLRDPGSYMVRNENGDNTVLSFTILNSVTSIDGSYEVPSQLYLRSSSLNGQAIFASGSLIDVSQEGTYEIQYGNTTYGYARTVTFNVDHTPPTLEIIGLTDGEARNAVTFGEQEPNSTIKVLLNGEEINLKEELTQAGQYHVIYTDEAGNESTYDFTIRVYFNLSAGLVVGIVLAIIIGVIIYSIYLRKNMRTF